MNDQSKRPLNLRSLNWRSLNLRSLIWRTWILVLLSTFLVSLAIDGSQRAAAQEQIPSPKGEVDPDAKDPFADEDADDQDEEDEEDDKDEEDLSRRGPTEPESPRFRRGNFDPMALDASTFDSRDFRDVSNFSLITQGTLDRLHSPILRQDLQINGAQSCAVSNCHNGPRPAVAQPWARRGSAYQLWVENDPHSRSWRTICGDESIAIMKRLHIMEGDKIVDQAGFDNCLACHNSVRRYNEPRVAVDPLAIGTANASDRERGECRIRTTDGDADDVNTFLREGVGCSSCHGPSERWINTHFQAGWSPDGATGEGFVEAGDLMVRARMCASCHVGDKDRDMNHDIIAAGHPALRYEMATFHAWQPKHWRDEEAADRTYYEAQLWLAGQIAAADASLSLIQTRAADAHSVSEWPEFSSYDCASCHHNLGLDNARKPIRDSRKATAMYSAWNEAGLRWLLDFRIETGVAVTEDYELLDAVNQVREQMESPPRSKASQVADSALAARMALARWTDGVPGMQERQVFRSDRLADLVVSAAGKRATFATWESTVQFYLAAVAARESWPGGWNGPLKNVADPLRSGLRYPEMIDVSRFAKRNSGGPTLNRADAMLLGIELAGQLGPVSIEEWFDVEDDEVITESLQRELEGMIRDINARWERKTADRIREGEKRDRERKLKEKEEKEEKDDEPEAKKLSPEELKQQLLERLNQSSEDNEEEDVKDESTEDREADTDV